MKANSFATTFPRSAVLLPRLIPVLGFAAVATVACSSRAETPPPRVPVSVARAERRSMPVEIMATGTVEPIRSVDVTSQVSGTLVRVRFAEGGDVAAGQVLFEIDRRPYQAAVQAAEANLGRDLAQAANARRDAERYGELVGGASVTQADYQQKQAAADALAAAVRADSAALAIARLNLEYATIRAPLAGRTGSVLVDEGSVVRANGAVPLVTINQLQPILVRFAVPADRLPDLRRRAGRPLRVLARTGRDEVTSLEGVLAFMDNRVDSTTGTVLLKARYPNRDGALWPGEYAQVTLVLEVQPDATVIPAQAVLTGQQGTYVFAVTPEGLAEPRRVAVARTVDSLAVISEGIEPGTLVVIDGQLRLTPNARVEIRSGPRSEATTP